MTVDMDKLTRPFPREAVKQRKGGGGRMYDYIPGDVVIRRLNEATDNTWDWHIVKLEWHGNRIECYGELTIPGHGTRAGIGVQIVADNSGEDLVKGASTDALKKAATLFGVALELYGPDVESGEIASQPAPRAPHAPSRRDTPPQDARLHEPARPAQGSPGEVSNPATDPQLKKIFVETRRLGWDKDHSRAELLNVTGKEHTKDLSIADASAFIEYLLTQTPADQLQLT